MRKILYFVAVSLLGVSCNRDDNNNEKEKPKDINVGFKVSTTQDLSNLQVGERLVVDFEIEDKDTINTTYVIKSEVTSVMYHQRRGTDFHMQVEDRDENNNYKYTNINELSLKSREQKGGFYLEILQPGSFQHKYILEKYVNGKKVGETTADFSFNAVKITAWTYHKELKNQTLIRRGKYARYYKFIIDDGNQQYDNYLENVNGKTHTYKAYYLGRYHYSDNGEISAHHEKEYRGEDYWKFGEIPALAFLASNHVDEISIQQKQADGTINNIIYKNIPIIKK